LFTVAQRDEFSGRVVELAQADARIVAGAVVGSFAIGAGDRYSDVDLTFAVADEVTTVLEDWTRLLVERFEGVPLVDLERPPTIYRVFLLPAALQFDLSMTPAALFRPAGPKFRLLFGETVPDPVDGGQQSVGDLFISTPAATSDIFGWGVIDALHARACIERGRVWQAEHYVGALRDHALALHVYVRVSRRARGAATANSRRRRSSGSHRATSLRPSLTRFVSHSPQRYLRYSTRASTPVSHTLLWSRSVSPNSVDVVRGGDGRSKLGTVAILGVQLATLLD
jgi:hypothetical protein